MPYYQVLNFGFAGLDDRYYVFDNRFVKEGLTSQTIKWAFSNFNEGNWHPLTWISHMMDVELFGLNAGGHHWTNFILHIASSVLLFFIFFNSTGALFRSFFLSGLFAVHPIHVESVVWVSERKDVLSTFFFMLVIIAYLNYAKDKSMKKYFLVFLCFCLGLMAKAMLVTLPFVLLLLDIWPLKRAFSGSGEDREGPKIKKLYLSYDLLVEKIPLLIPTVIFSVIAVIAQKSAGAMASTNHIIISDRIANSFISYVSYGVKFLWPFNLACFYPLDPQNLTAWKIWASIFMVLLVSMATLMNIRKTPYFFVGWCWYLGTLIPVIGLVQVGGQAMADRYTYIPSIGFFIICVWGLHDLLTKMTRSKKIVCFFGRCDSGFLVCPNIYTSGLLG